VQKFYVAKPGVLSKVIGGLIALLSVIFSGKWLSNFQLSLRSCVSNGSHHGNNPGPVSIPEDAPTRDLNNVLILNVLITQSFKRFLHRKRPGQ